jgi:heme/copper-type cytochrome/quinol oxidase subunit 2
MIQSAIGMSIAAFVLGVVAITFFFVLRKRRSANELRRIQALDS